MALLNEINVKGVPHPIVTDDGYYQEMTVGDAEQLVATTFTEDDTPYNFRTAGGAIDIGDREYINGIVGGTVAWNQLAKERMAQQTQNGITSTYSDGVFTLSGTATGGYTNNTESVYIQTDHVYFMGLNILANPNGVSFKAGSLNGGLPFVGTTTAEKVDKVSVSSRSVSMGIQNIATGSVMDGIKYQYNIIDLTAMFGKEIADYIYGLEQANAGDGVAWFRKYFPKPYYAYNAGSLQSVNVASHDMTGFNQWDEEWELGQFDNSTGQPISASNCIRSKNFIIVMPSTEYYTTYGNGNMQVFFYKADESYISQAWVTATNLITTPSDCYKMKFRNASSYGTTYKGDICINRVWTGYRNGEYEEYVKHSYQYDESVELRGMPQLVDGELKYDGDIYESSGKVTRKYGIVDLGTIDWLTDPNRVSVFRATITGKRAGQSSADRKSENGVLCGKYYYINEAVDTSKDKYISDYPSYGAYQIFVRDTAYTDVATFKTAMSGVYLIYQFATHTEETATGFTNPQICDDFGTEEYVDAGVKNNTRDVAIPVGHVTQYMANLRDKLQHLPSLASSDGDYIIGQSGTSMSLKPLAPYFNAEHPNLTAGSANQLLSTITIEDQTPYTFRTSGGSVDIGDRETDMIVGGTIAWNQLCSELNSTNFEATYSTITYSDGVATIVANHNYGRMQMKSSKVPTIFASHKYIVSADIKTKLSHQFYPLNLKLNGTIAAKSAPTPAANAWANYSDIVNAGSGNASYFYFGDVSDKYTEGDEVQVKNIQIFDLTQMFGSTIADYIYSLETANAGAGVSYFRALFPKPYYEYCALDLRSVSGLQSHDMRGFNAWDETYEANKWLEDVNGTIISKQGYNLTDFIKIIPNATYYKAVSGSGRALFYDADKNVLPSQVWNTISSGATTFTAPSDAHYIRFVITPEKLSEFILNLSWDGERDGEYEPYTVNSYALDDSLTLRGIPKLDASNNLYYDGDTYESDGTVTRRYGVVDLGTLTWTRGNTTNRFATTLSDAKRFPDLYTSGGSTPVNIVCSKYTTISGNSGYEGTTDKAISGSFWNGENKLQVNDSTYGDATSFKTAMSGVYLVYELATPTTESAEPYTNPQIVDDFGTEEYVTDSIVPVGHVTQYQPNLRAKLEMAPESPEDNGYYVVYHHDGINEYVPLIIPQELPNLPTEDGTYTLKCTVASGSATLSFESEV